MFKFIKSMMWFVKKNWYRYLLVLFFGLLHIIFNLMPATIISDLTAGIEEGIVTKDFLIYDILIPFVLIVVGFYIVATFKRLCQNRLTTTLYFALHSRYMEQILTQDATFFETFKSGDLLTRALGDINSVKFSGGNRLISLFLEMTSVVAIFIAMCFINLPLAVCCFIPLTLIFITNLILKAKVKRNYKIVREKSSEMGNVVLESITNVRTIRAFSKEDENFEKNLKYSQITYDVEKSNLKINVIFQPMFQSIVAVSTIICYGLGAYFYSINQITIPQLIQFVMYLGLFQNPLTNVGNIINNFYQSLISADRLNEVYDSKSKVIDYDNADILNRVDKIEFKNFSFKYEGDEFDVLKDINLTIKSGQTVGIVGHTGSGKTTLVKQLVRQLPIENGTLFINDNPIESFEQETVRSRVGYVPQEHVLFSRSVEANVALGGVDPSDEEIAHAIALADFEKDIENLPNGLDTIVGEYGVTLSGGQKQRLGIARAFLRNADILILDDSLSAVDGKTEANIISTLKNHRSNKTNIIVAHRLSAVMHADEIIVLEDGKVIERGNHDHLMNLKGWYYDQFILQQMDNKEGE